MYKFFVFLAITIILLKAIKVNHGCHKCEDEKEACRKDVLW